MAKRKKKRQQLKSKSAELNIMPFIDIFSMLNTFLLVSAAFINLGILEVQIPFLSNAPEEKDKPQRSLSINVDILPDKIELATSYTAPPENRNVQTYALTEQGANELHSELVRLRGAEPETDLVTIFSEDEVKYDQLVLVIDAIKSRRPEDPKFSKKDEKTGEDIETDFIYEKVVIGSVIL